jgi:hypothetical protein
MLVNLTGMLYDSNVHTTLEEIRDCFSRDQIASKLWLIDELNNLNIAEDLKILILGGWMGSLANLLFQFSNTRIRKIVNVDIDPRCTIMADYLNMKEFTEDWRFKAFEGDMYQLNYDNLVFTDEHYEMCYHPNVIVNTSCEHVRLLHVWLSLLPHRSLVVLQSNNYFDHPQHVNCVHSVDELEEKCGSRLNTVLYKGILSTELYDRYMIIGMR